METYGIEKFGIIGPKAVYRNLTPAQLTEAALRLGEGKLSNTGALVVTTGKYTGRSPKDKFIVDTEGVHDEIAWGKVNRPISREKFNSIKGKIASYLQNREIFIFDGFAGADKTYTQKFRVINELASQNLFIHQLLIRPTAEELASYGEPDYTILCAPGFKCDPEVDGVNSEACIAIDYEAHEIIICGSRYAGEIKKSVFATMNYVMTKKNVLPMHCSANMDPETHETAVFFGLSGTGKTTLSADPARKLIGDDEHGWSPDGVFNLEGGCYAKCINYIDNAEIPSKGGIPKVVVFLTADAFGVLPPISRLDKNAAMYHFVTGFTSKLAGTERGVTEPQPTFSTLFGEPFMPMDASVYAKMLGEKLDKYGTKVYLVNTGWAGGSAASGAKRMKLAYTRAMVSAALNVSFDNVEFKHHDVFNVDYPTSCPNVPDEMLDARGLWADKNAYDEAANKLAQMFADNFAAKYPNMPSEIVNAGPKAKTIA